MLRDMYYNAIGPVTDAALLADAGKRAQHTTALAAAASRVHATSAFTVGAAHHRDGKWRRARIRGVGLRDLTVPSTAFVVLGWNPPIGIASPRRPEEPTGASDGHSPTP